MMNTDTPNASDGYAEGEQGISPTLDATLDLLSNRRRRYVLYYLRDEGRGVTVDELAEQIVAWERDAGEEPTTSIGQGDGTHRERVTADLHHCHLPRLTEAGAVTYDDEEGYVTLADADERPLTEYLDLAAREENLR
ncbi:DUF7344 domain-containing protein [Halorussus litoreus]|uniref:DUF7344 domain-containing protein n=1 Tax=Halorussus litoreus TaxID=1710536 RepID=UPI000E2694E5|nr:hypothetical protein [Halorussus litoreus]